MQMMQLVTVGARRMGLYLGGGGGGGGDAWHCGRVRRRAGRGNTQVTAVLCTKTLHEWSGCLLVLLRTESVRCMRFKLQTSNQLLSTHRFDIFPRCFWLSLSSAVPWTYTAGHHNCLCYVLLHEQKECKELTEQSITLYFYWMRWFLRSGTFEALFSYLYEIF